MGVDSDGGSQNAYDPRFEWLNGTKHIIEITSLFASHARHPGS